MRYCKPDLICVCDRAILVFHLRGITLSELYDRYAHVMKAPDFRYHCPDSLADALAYLADEKFDCQPLAGGQSLLPMMNLRLAQPDILLDLNRLKELDFVVKTASHIEIGAMVRYRQLNASALIRECIPLFVKALPHIAHEAIRNRGTIGGSVALADPAAEMPALLIALDAIIVVQSITERREIAAAEFFLGIYDTALAENELVHSIRVPIAKPEQRFGFYELTRRHGDYAMAGVAIAAQSVQPCANLRIVFFAIGDSAVRATDTEACLAGALLSHVDALKRAEESVGLLDYNADLNASGAMKSRLAAVVLRRALASMQG